MHTTPDHTTKARDKDAPELWIIHNVDFSGPTFVCWKVNDMTYQWELKDGTKLLTGMIVDEDLFDQFAAPVPTWVVGRAVQVAVRHELVLRMESFMDEL